MPVDLKKDDMGDVITDFYKSDAPQFKGKSKKKRREMAIAAKLSSESVVIEEGSYKDFVKKAQEASERSRKAKQAQRDSNAKSAYKDKVTKGVRFYDKKGKGHIRDGKKVYS